MSVASEQIVVVAAIHSAEKFETLCDIVKSSDFTDDKARCLWDMVYAYREAGRTVSIVIMSAVLDRSARWKDLRVRAPALDYLAALEETTAGYNDFLDYANVVKNASMDRQIIDYSDAVRELGQNGDYDADQKLGEVHAMLTPLASNQPSKFLTAKESVQAAVDDIAAQIERGSSLSGLSTGYAAIDEITSGLQDSALYIVAGRPSMGKSIFMMGLADHVAKTNRVLIFSLEMASKDLAKRSLSKLSSIKFGDIQNGHLEEQTQSRLYLAGMELMNLDMLTDDTPSLSIDQIKTRVRIEARKKKPRLILIDFLTLIKGGEGDNQHLKIGDIAKQLKALAKEMVCPVVVLSQLNRSLENRPNKRPQLSDLRESGNIEEAADVVIFLYRGEVYDEEERPGVLEAIVAKQRNGPTGTRFLKSELEYVRFSDLTEAVPALEKKSKTFAKPLSAVLKGSAANAMEDF